MKTIEGIGGIKATVICDSVSEKGIRLTTYELEYPRIIHAEVMTHRDKSRNAASSRAIPAEKMFQQLTAAPVRFGANIAGMQDNGEHTALVEVPPGVYHGKLGAARYNHMVGGFTAAEIWEMAKSYATRFSKALSDAGYHKQVFNRLTEPFQMIKVVMSATEWANFFWLRNDSAADPTLQELARCMLEAYKESTPTELCPGEWHLPYITIRRNDSPKDGIRRQGYFADGEIYYYLDAEMTQTVDLEDAIKVSCARCAAVSFRNVDYDVEKSRVVYDRLVGSERKHASAFEHCATPIADEYLPRTTMNTLAFNVPHCPDTWEKGISHMDRNGQLWSGNLRGWIQYRKLIDGENYEGDF